MFQEKVEPLELVPDEGWRWPGAELNDGLKLPTFTRAIPRSRAPPKPAGMHLCSEETKRLWREDKMKFPPYTYLPHYLFVEKGNGERRRVASADERERLMGFPTGYTCALFKKEASNAEEEEEQEVARQAALGNSFHAVVVAVLLDLWMMFRGERCNHLGASKIVSRWHQLMGMNAGGLSEDEEGQADLPLTKSLTEDEMEESLLERLPQKRIPRSMRLSGKEIEAQGEMLAERLIHEFLRRTEFRGSDVRLDVGTLYRPDVAPRSTINPRRWRWVTGASYPWRRREHINVLELRTVLQALEWRSRASQFHSCRVLHLSDSQVCLGVLTKGRSSSRKLNRILRRICSLCLALNAFPIWAWIASRLNPADAPSRRYEPKD